ncbi:hypothetical protein ABPG74_001587 [Tetrahymena malaccensis]
MILGSKNILKRLYLSSFQKTGNQKKNVKLLQNLNQMFASRSLSLIANRSFSSINNFGEKGLQLNEKKEQKQIKKGENAQRRQRLTEKEESDDSDNENDSKLKQNMNNESQIEDENQQADQQEINKLTKARNHSAYDSNDSIENLIGAESLNDENLQNTQKLLNKILKGEVEFEEGDSIDKLVSLEDVFKTRERRLSFQLMEIENPQRILQFYNEEVERIKKREGEEDPLSVDEISLFFYFATFQKKFISDNATFQKILVQIIENSKDLSADSIQTFVWSLGSYMYEFGFIELSEQQKKNLSDSILKKCQFFDYAQNPSLCFALSQIFQGENDGALSQPIVDVLATTSAKYIETLTHDELITMIMTFMTVEYSNSSTISKFVERLVQIKEELDEEQIQKAISALGELNYGNSKQFSILTKEILDRDSGNSEPNMSTETACSMIFTLSGAQEKNEELLRKLLRIVHSKYKEMNITSYVNLWLGLARFRIDPTKYEQTFSILHKVLGSGHVFQIKDLNNDEIIRIVIAASSLKLNNKPLVGDLLNNIQNRMRLFKTDQLVLLARSTVIYVKQFESFFVSVHGECLAKLDKFTPEQKQILKQTFNRTRILFPHSPLIDTSI